MSLPLPQVQPGDVLLYRGRSFWSWFIRLKTWAPTSHVEGVVSATQVIAARQCGVGRFSLTTRDLYAVLRPTEPFALEPAMAWFAHNAEGQGYHYWGLFRFFLLGRPSSGEHTKMFCSELLVRWFRAGGFDAFAPGYDADKTSPGMFLSSPKFDEIWRIGA